MKNVFRASQRTSFLKKREVCELIVDVLVQ